MGLQALLRVGVLDSRAEVLVGEWAVVGEEVGKKTPLEPVFKGTDPGGTVSRVLLLKRCLRMLESTTISLG